jgi:hypothetical protein
MNKKRRIFLGTMSYLGFKCPSFNRSFLDGVKELRAQGYSVDGAAITGCSFVQAARNMVVHEFLAGTSDVVVFLDDDMSWKAKDLVRLVETPGKIVGGAYRLKKDEVEYAVETKAGKHGIPLTRPDGCILAWAVATGFMKIERCVFEKIQVKYPHLQYGKEMFDFFPQGVYDHIWVGEDYAFCRLWANMGGDIWTIPDIDFIHHGRKKDYSGNYHEYLKGLPGKLEKE